MIGWPKSGCPKCEAAWAAWRAATTHADLATTHDAYVVARDAHCRGEHDPPLDTLYEEE